MKSHHFVLLPVLGLPACAIPCCAVGLPGSPVGFTSQANIVVWDDKAGIEHFIRNASFSTAADSMGFIAPTPTVPEVKEVNDLAFNVLRALSPFQEDHPEMTRSSGAFGGGGGKVDIVQQVDAAGYRITTVKATDSRALAQWMKANQFVTNSEIEEWSRFYIKKSWFLSLFKVLKREGQLQTGTVRLSFKTERPFNPYLVPKVNFPQGATTTGLELYLITNERYEGAIGDKQYSPPRWVEQLTLASAEALREHLKLGPATLKAGMRVANFKDSAFPRAVSDDLIFYPVDKSGRIRNGTMASLPFELY